MLKKSDLIIKRIFDIAFSVFLLIIFGFFIIFLIFQAQIDTKQSGIFKQIRIGQNGKPFTIYKIRSIKNHDNNQPAISKFGRFLRKSKLDEWPQLYNILKGDMSFVGPRPDLPGFADLLKGEDKIILKIKPGLTGPASLYFKNEEEILMSQCHPESYNRSIIWPQKILINKEYMQRYSFLKDLEIILKTVLG